MAGTLDGAACTLRAHRVSAPPQRACDAAVAEEMQQALDRSLELLMRSTATISAASLLPLPLYARVAETLLSVLGPFAAAAKAALFSRESWLRSITAQATAAAPVDTMGAALASSLMRGDLGGVAHLGPSFFTGLQPSGMTGARSAAGAGAMGGGGMLGPGVLDLMLGASGSMRGSGHYGGGA